MAGAGRVRSFGYGLFGYGLLGMGFLGTGFLGTIVLGAVFWVRPFVLDHPTLSFLLCSLITTLWGKASDFLKWYIHSNDSKNKKKERKEKCINRKGKGKETIK